MTMDKAYGMMYGLAIGDALGYPVEFMNLEEIKRNYGSQGLSGPIASREFLFSDDTQMTIAVARGLIECGEDELDPVMEALAREFIRWKNSPDNNRAPGKTCTAGVENLERGISWRESGIPDGKGCGSAMRVAPVGYLYSKDPERLKERAYGSGIMTHGHPAADGSCIGAAYLVKLALEGGEPREFIPRTLTFVEGISSDFEEKLLLVEKLLKEGVEEEEALHRIGEGWTGHEAVPLGLYCFLRYPDDYVKAVLRGANTNGDSDSIACIAGFISGARLGREAIPEEWIQKIERSEELGTLAENLWEKKKKFFS